jgi:hypothetical protein
MLRSFAMGLLRRAALGLVLVFAAAAHDAGASVSIAIPFDALVGESSAAAVITPVTQTSLWQGGRIFTYTDVHVDQGVAGAALPESITVRTMGGDVGNIGQAVEGEAVLTVGRPSLLFLHPASAISGDDGTGLTSHAATYVVTARAQGQFAVVADAQGELRVRRSSAVGALVAPRGSTAPVMAGDALHGNKVNDARDAILRVWSRVHAP